MIKITVPATSANIGAGFDSMGLALDMYNLTYVTESGRPGDLTIETDPDIPADKTNFVYTALVHTLGLLNREVPGLHIRQVNGIPKTSGMGSSAACIVTGVYLADALCGGRLSEREKIDICNGLDGHPDNVVPCITGGVTASAVDGVGRVTYIKADTDIKVLAVIPSFGLPTEYSREILPTEYSRQDAVFNISHAVLTMGALIRGDAELLARAVGDRLHQDYRRPLIEDYDRITALCRESGAIATYLSGAGPTIAAFVDGSFDAAAFDWGLVKFPKWRSRIYAVPTGGVRVENEQNKSNNKG